MPRSFVIGVTGGIGSGKSAVTARFEALGVPVFDADIEARRLVEPGELALAEIIAVFGAEILDSRGHLNRAALRERVFNDGAAREQLNAILHPRVHVRLRTLAEQADSPYVMLAVPLLVETIHRYDWLDRILVVDVPVALQMQRAMQRDGMDITAARRMLATQASRDQRLAQADDVIVNDGSLADLDGIVARLHQQYLSLAAAR